MSLHFGNSPHAAPGRVVSVMFFVLSVSAALGSDIDAEYREVLNRAPQDTTLSVVIRPVGTLNPRTLKADMIGGFPAVDLLPGQCPNVMSLADAQQLDRPRTAGALPPSPVVEMAVVSQEGYDATIVNPVSAALNGVTPIRWRIADVATPLPSYESGSCECQIALEDGREDLILTYNRDSLLATFSTTVGYHSVLVRLDDALNVTWFMKVCLRVTAGPVRYPTPPKTQGPTLAISGPNPFNASTGLTITISTSERVRLEIFDVLGRDVVTLLDGAIGAGVHEFAWDARDARGINVASGVYFARLTAPGGTLTRKLVLLK